MHLIDWSIVLGVLVILLAFAVWAKRYTRSVADFLSANRCAGRYMLCVAEGMAVMGAIQFVAIFEANYAAGFAHNWWVTLFIPIHYILPLSGWVIYRFRQTRALTLAQFFEIRYSHRFRVFAGTTCFISGIINFGIFPGISARFFMYFFQLPAKFEFMGIEVSTFVTIMAILLFGALFFTFMGGQISVLVIDFLQGGFSMVVFVAILALLLYRFNWDAVINTLTASVSPGKSMLNPFDTGQVKSFNIWFYIIMHLGMIYSCMGWQANQGFNSSALSPHEARMGRVVGLWRNGSLGALLLFVPICAFVVMHNPSYSSIATEVNRMLANIGNESMQVQMTTPLVLSNILPAGALGAFGAVMLCAFLASANSNLHSWGSIFIQDVVLPLRKEPLTQKQHMLLLRLSIGGVSVFIFLWSCFFRLEDYLYMYFFVTGAIFMGGAGAVIIGGLYWKKGTTMGAYSAMIVGTSVAVIGIVLKLLYPNAMLHGQWINGIAMGSGIFAYILVSLLGRKHCFNMDKMLHRGIYQIMDDTVLAEEKPTMGWKKLIGINNEFTKTDMIPYVGSVIISLVFWGISLVILGCHLFSQRTANMLNDRFWGQFWKFIVIWNFATGIICTVWILIGGSIDFKRMFQRLTTIRRSSVDDGRVVDNQNLADKTGTETVSSPKSP